MNKRKLSDYDGDGLRDVKTVKKQENIKKNSLDSDEEDDEVDEADYILNEEDIEGEEDGVPGQYDEVRTTAFNMKEELEEGHFDKDGHYIWNKDKEIKDNWLDNIDWQVIKQRPQKENKSDEKGLGEDSDSDEDEPESTFEEIGCYKDILKFMEPKETIAKALQRLGKSKKKLSTIERIKLKKAGLLDTNEQVIKLTELTNNLLKHTGNMDIYQETFEAMSKIVENSEKPTKKEKNEELDMYADDFDDKEKEKLDLPNIENAGSSKENKNIVMWEFKWNQDDDKIEGPNTSDQMQKWIEDGYFNKPIWVRRCGQPQFYSSARIDFELYIS